MDWTRLPHDRLLDDPDQGPRADPGDLAPAGAARGAARGARAAVDHLPALRLALHRVVHAGRRHRVRDPLLPRPPAARAARADADARGRGRDPRGLHEDHAPRGRPRAGQRLRPRADARGGGRSSAAPASPTAARTPRTPTAAPSSSTSTTGTPRATRWRTSRRPSPCGSARGAAGGSATRAGPRWTSSVHARAHGQRRRGGPRRTTRRREEPLARVRMTLREYYDQKKGIYASEGTPAFNGQLRHSFPRGEGPGQTRRASRPSSASTARASCARSRPPPGQHRYLLDHVVREMALRARRRTSGSPAGRATPCSTRPSCSPPSRPSSSTGVTPGTTDDQAQAPRRRPDARPPRAAGVRGGAHGEGAQRHQAGGGRVHDPQGPRPRGHPRARGRRARADPASRSRSASRTSPSTCSPTSTTRASTTRPWSRGWS